MGQRLRWPQCAILDAGPRGDRAGQKEASVGRPVVSKGRAAMTSEALKALAERVEGATLWREVPGWPYEASSAGELRSSRTGRILRPVMTAKGYQCCTFQVDKVRRNVRIHRAIVEAWIGPIPKGYEVNHIDGNKVNNAPSNLEIVTSLENNRHAARLGLKASGVTNGAHTQPHRRRRGVQQGNCKLTEAAVLAIRQSTEPLSRMAAIYGVHKTLISQIRRRKLWTHI